MVRLGGGKTLDFRIHTMGQQGFRQPLGCIPEPRAGLDAMMAADLGDVPLSGFAGYGVMEGAEE